MSWKNTRNPQQALREGDGVERKTLLLPIWYMDGTANHQATVELEIRTPSSRLSGSFEMFYEPDPGYDYDLMGARWTTSYWSLRAYSRGRNRNRNPLNYVDPVQNPFPAAIATEQLPRSWEFTSNIPILVADCFLTQFEDIAINYVPGTWYARATWEPNVEFSDKSELLKLFGECQLFISRPVAV